MNKKKDLFAQRIGRIALAELESCDQETIRFCHVYLKSIGAKEGR